MGEHLLNRLDELCVTVYHLVGIDIAQLNFYIKVDNRLVAPLFYIFRERGFVNIDFTVLETAFKHFTHHIRLLHFFLVDGLFDFVACLRGNHEVEPVLSWRLVGGSENLDGVATLQLVVELLVFAIDLCADASATHFRVNVESEVEHGRAQWQLKEVAFRSEHKHLFIIKVHVHFTNQPHLTIAASLKHLAHIVHPHVHIALTLDALVLPVCGKSTLSNLVHSLRAHLHLHPLIFLSSHGDVERLVAVRLRHRNPVLQARYVGGVDVGDDRIRRPAITLLLLLWRVENDANGKQVVHVL